MTKKSVLILGWMGLSVCLMIPRLPSATGAVPAETRKIVTCPATKEFVTALEFLRSHEEFAVKDQAAQELANRVSLGCEGSAKRFISTALLLRGAELNSAEAIQIGAEYALKSDAATATFATVFKKAFVPEYLDLDLRSAIHMAQGLSSELKSDQATVRKDFERLLESCVHSKKLDLPRPQCGAFAMRITRKGESWNGGAALPFQNAFDFLVSDKGPALTTGDALKVAEELISDGPGAVENFTQAYKYAVSEKGMNSPREQAIAFARKMAERKAPGSEEKAER